MRRFSSTKLLIATWVLLIGAFVMLSMSLPDEQSNGGHGNHSGPRRSHYFNKGTCGDTKHGALDYAKAIAITTGGGRVKISSPTGGGDVTNEGGTSDTNNGDQVSVEWNCGSTADMSNNNNKTTIEAHTRQIRFEAIADENHNFAGWSTSADKDDIKVQDNPYEETMIIDDWDQNNGSHESEQKALTIQYYAIFKEKVLVNITMAVPDKGTYTFSCEESSGTISTTEQSVQTKNEIILVASPNEGYKFFGWYTPNGSEEEYFSYSAKLSITFDTDVTICAKFIPADMAIFKVGDEEFWDLNKANTTAETSSSQTIILANDGKLYAGDYKIGSGITLLIPNNDANTYSLIPNEVKSRVDISLYRKLTMQPQSKITIYGAVCVAGEQYGTSSDMPGPGAVSGKYGCIDMSQGGHITIENGANLYAQGFIVGKDNQTEAGTITIKRGGIVYENIVINDMHGGGGTAATVNGPKAKNDFGLFPFNQYYIQNIEPKMTIEYGGIEKVAYDVRVSVGGKHDYASLIGNDKNNLFTMTDGCTITKWYDASRDYQCYAISGDFYLNELSIYATNSIGLVSSNFVLPITNNMDITILYGGIGHLDKPMKLLPGAKLMVESGGRIELNSELYVYDCNEWDKFAISYIRPMSSVSSAGWKVSRKDALDMGNASLIVDGTINVGAKGTIYTTTTGASIVSSENGRGTISYISEIVSEGKSLYEIWTTYGRSTNDDALKQSGKDAKGNGPASDQVLIGSYLGYSTYGTPVATTPAQLKNADGSYLATAGALANTTINYRNGHWGWLTKWIDYDGTTVLHQEVGLGGKYAEGYAYAGDIPSDKVWASWQTITDEENQEVTHIAQLKEDPASTVGNVIDIVDWTPTSVMLNLNGIPAAGWPYTINDEEYTKDQRSADRTLTIPYEGSADDGLVITLTKNGGEVYSRHTYTIPHIITTSADLAGVQATSTVFVKDDAKLSVTKNVSVSKIVVAPGAELFVNSGVTLTVGDLLLRTTAWQAAILDNQGTINATHTYYTRIVASNSQYYQFALPLASNVKDVTLSTKSKCTYGVSWLLKSYDEASRAKNGKANTETLSNWKQLEADASGSAAIAGSVGYEMFSNTPYYREFYFPVVLPASKTTEVPVSHTDGAAGAAHAGWNALCSPLTGKFTQTFSTPSEAIKVSELTDEGNYLQSMPTVIYPAVPFYYQAPKRGTLDFSGSELKLIQKAPQRAWNTSVSEQWLRLMLNDAAGKMLDETNIFTHPEKFSVNYESGYDVIKQSTTGGKALLYSELVCGALAFAALPDSVAESRIPLTVYAAEAKPYTFHLEDNAYLNRLNNVFLHDMETGAVIDLLASDYEVSLREGTTRGRFYITCVFRAQNVTTNIETTVQDKQTATIQKVFYNGKVYILRNGIVYDLTGRQCEMK